MRKAVRSWRWLAAVALVLTCQPSAAVRLSFPDEPDFMRLLAAGDPATLEQIVRSTYYLHARYVRNAGGEVRYRISDVHTDSGGFLDREFYELVSRPVGDGIQVSRQSRSDGAAGLRTVQYAAQWVPLPGSESVQALAGRSLRQVVADAGDDRADLERLQAVTSYRLRITMAGRTRVVRAAFLWMADDSPTGWKRIRIMPVDPFVQGLERVLTEDIPSGGSRLPSAPFATKAAGGGCYEYSTTTQVPLQRTKNSDKHQSTSTYHSGGVGVDFKCSCNLACTSTCEPSFRYREVNETGGASIGWHYMSQEEDVSVATIQGATSAGASCAAAFVVGAKQCTFPGCALSVSVELNGTSASFGTTEAFWAFKRSFPTSCSACQIDPNYDPNYQPGGGTAPPPDNQDPFSGDGGGGGFGATGCTTTISVPETGGYWVNSYPNC